MSNQNTITIIGHFTSILLLIGFVMFLFMINKGLRKMNKRARKIYRKRKAAGFKKP
jgi:uncharacterized BrkB/YihY/UPF0761 family membrane protein